MDRHRSEIAERASSRLEPPASPDAGRGRLWPLLLWILPFAFLALFYFWPLANILWLSLNRATGSVLAPFAELIERSSLRSVIGFTVWQALLSTLLTLLIGLPGAYLFARFKFAGKSILRALTGIPFVLPTVVVAAAFNALLGPSGWFNSLLIQSFDLPAPPIRFTNTFVAILTAHVFYNTTIVLRMVGDFWSNLNPRLRDAARNLGAGPLASLRHVTVPLLMPAIATASLLTFIFNFTSFGVVLLLGGPRFATIEVEIYYQTVSLFNLPIAAALSILQLALTLSMTIAYTRLAERVTRPLPLQAREVTQQRPDTPASRLLAIGIAAALIILLVLPLAGLAFRSVTRLPSAAGAGFEFTLNYYRALDDSAEAAIFYVPPLAAVGNSFRYALATIGLALLLGAPAAWALASAGHSRLSRAFDPILMLPLGTSAVTLGLGFIVALDSPPLNLRASPVLIPLAHTLVAFPFVVRSLTPALRSIQPRLREAAAILGANPLQVLRHVDLPLVARALIVAAAFAFTISMGEFGATALIARPENPTIPVAIFRFLGRPGAINFGQAMALSTILMIVTGGGMLAIERFRIADVGEF